MKFVDFITSKNVIDIRKKKKLIEKKNREKSNDFISESFTELNNTKKKIEGIL